MVEKNNKLLINAIFNLTPHFFLPILLVLYVCEVKMKKQETFREHIEESEPNPVDVHVGKRIRLRRTILHITQQKMAEMLGLTFQQVQKYEKGMNRVGASRLWDISRVLNVPMSFFFEDMDDDVVLKSPRMLKGRAPMEVEDRVKGFDDPMKRDETIELVRAYYKIPNRAVAKQLFDLMVSVSKSSVNLVRPEISEEDDD